MSDVHLPNSARKTIRALIEIVKPRSDEFDPPVEDYMLDFLDNFYGHFPWHLKIAFPMGIYLLEFGTFIFHAWSKPFSKLSEREREVYIDGWVNSTMFVRRDLIKGVKGVCLTAYYSHPDVMAHIGYDLPVHMDRVTEGDAADQTACDFFRGLGYDNNTMVPYPAYDRVDLVTHDTPAKKGDE
jgi:hypothetical protein